MNISYSRFYLLLEIAKNSSLIIVATSLAPAGLERMTSLACSAFNFFSGQGEQTERQKKVIKFFKRVGDGFALAGYFVALTYAMTHFTMNHHSQIKPNVIENIEDLEISSQIIWDQELGKWVLSFGNWEDFRK